jgi:hypothetical protein
LQLERRCKLRAIMMADIQNRSNWSNPAAHHWAVQDWRSFIVRDDAPNLLQWDIGSALPEVRQTNHLVRGPRRLAQRLLYSIGFPAIFDRARPSWTDEAHPLPIPSATQEVLGRELRT